MCSLLRAFQVPKFTHFKIMWHNPHNWIRQVILTPSANGPSFLGCPCVSNAALLTYTHEVGFTEDQMFMPFSNQEKMHTHISLYFFIQPFLLLIYKVL